MDDVQRLSKDAREAGEASTSRGNLALLYEGLLTIIVRVQSSRQHIPDGETFRKRTKTSLRGIEDAAVSSGYDRHDVTDTHFAVVALLDSVVLHSNDPVRGEWERKSLQEELFGQTDAGVVFFEKLERFHARRDSEQLANILEVYLLCLLLGFEGRYSGGLRAELESVVERTRKRIDHFRGRSRQISPSGVLVPDQNTAEVPPVHRIDRFRLVTFAALIFTILCFLAFKLDLVWTSEMLRGKLP